MTNALTDHRTLLRDILSDAGIDHAFVIVPERVTPPFAYVGPGLPYVTYEGATFGGMIAHFAVGVVASKGTNEVAAEELDDLVLRVLDAVAADGRYQVNEVDNPGRITLNGQTYLACSIDIQTEIHR